MKNNSIEQIANLLPEGLTEDVIEKIASLVHTKIQEEVNAKTEDLTVKVKAYLRGQVDRLKEQAIKELELENETFRSAKLFESAKALFVTELTPEDETAAVDLVNEENNGLERKLDVLTMELDKSLRENVQLKKMLKVVSDKNTRLTESVKEAKETLAESRAINSLKLSDTAEVVSKENFQRQGKRIEERKDSVKPETNGNKFLTEEVIRLMSN
jgi:small-conductance mechanosensitive channel